ncbi:phage tail sheath subtilisin-like domain-containing protein [Kitasatospora sp. NPDC001660]
MPVNITYPGVYIEEVPSSVRTITGVPTSIAAFVGYAPRGRVDDPVHITSWADYQAIFGGLHADSPMSYAVYQFYANGGSEAEIVRIIGDMPPLTLPIGDKPTAGADTRPTLEPTSPGVWAMSLRARVEYDDHDTANANLYSLTIRDTDTGAQETYPYVSVDDTDPLSLQNVLRTSQLVVFRTSGNGVRPLKNADPKTGDDPFADPSPDKPQATTTPHTGNGASGESSHGDGGTDAPAPAPAPAPTATAAPLKFTTPVTADSTTTVPDKDVMPLIAEYRGGKTEKTDKGGKTGEADKGDETGEADKKGIYALLKTDIFNLLCLPGCPDDLLSDAANLCVDRRAILLVDPPKSWNGAAARDVAAAITRQQSVNNVSALPALGLSARNAAIYYPRVQAPDSLNAGRTDSYPPCGVMAGVHARTDVSRGVWKAAAGTDASLNGVTGLETLLTDAENGLLNPLGVNCLRVLPAVGPVAWGARTMRGADRLTDEWKYLPVRRLALFVEESLFRGTQWVVFEPNDEPLWASIRLNVGAFMNSLFREGAFQGRTPDEAYHVKCDRENNPQNDIDRGIVNILVGFAPLKPAEFVIVHIQQLAGQIQV